MEITALKLKNYYDINMYLKYYSQHQEIRENMIKRCMTHDINTIYIPQYNPSQWGVIQIGF